MAKKKRTDRDAEKRRLAFYAGQRKIARRRTVIGILGFIPLLASLGCGLGAPFDALCFVPREWWLLVWAAAFGSFLGLTIRLILERRRFERGTSGGRAA
jgi:hypothetical protein